MTVGMKDQVAGTAGANSFTMEMDSTWAGSTAANGFTGDTVSLVGLSRSFDHYDGMGGTDTLSGTSGNDALVYSTVGSAKDPDPAHYVSIEQFLMNGGDDVLDLTSASGGSASYAVNATLAGNAGNDVLWAGRGADTVFGDSMLTIGGASPAGADRLVGGAGDDTVYGEGRTVGMAAAPGNDLIDGGAGDDLLFGDARIFGGDFTGARGHNTFRFDGPGSGQDTIGASATTSLANGFQHGLDHLQLSAKYGYATGADALSHTTDTGAGGFALVSLGGADSITLYGVHKADLTASDFTIA